MTISDVAARLKIRAMFVDAIERDRWDTIGEPVYVRGFVKSYARFIGLDPAPLLDELSATYPSRPPVNDPAVEPQSEARDEYGYDTHVRAQRQSSFYTWLLGALTPIAAVLVYLVVRVYFFAPQDTTASTQMQTQAQPAVTTAATPAAVADQSGLYSSSEQARGVVLRLQLTQDCWLSVTVDGKRVVYETLRAGTVREFRATHAITLRAGNAGGVIAAVDGQPLGTLGTNGQVQDRTFAAKTNGLGGPNPGE